MKNRIYGVARAALLLVLPCVALTSCDDDDKDSPEIEEQGTDVEYDGLQWFEESLIDHDEEGNTIRLYGCVLDEAKPRSITIGVDSRENAEEMFRSWIAPGDEKNVKTLSDGTIEYRPTSETGSSQGLIRMEMSEGGESLAHVSFAEGAEIKEVSDITFISNDAWPENGEIIVKSPYELGEQVRFDTDKGFSEKMDGDQWGICIKKATRSESGILLYVSNSSVYLSHLDNVSPMLPGPTMAKQLSSVLRENWSSYEDYFEAAGYKLTDDYYWVDAKKSFYGRRAVCLKTGKENWFDTMSRRPKHHYLLYRTFECMIDDVIQ